MLGITADNYLLVRANSGFATPELYNLCQKYDVEFLVRLKDNETLKKYSQEAVNAFMDTYGSDYTRQHVLYDEFLYQAKRPNLIF